MSITVADALKVGAMARCKLIAGSEGLNRKVSYIDTMEVPNIQPWLKKNLLLITTGYSIKDDAQALSRVICDLKKAGAAGLAIKTRFLGDVSEETIRLADRLALPLIEIPKDIPFVELTMPLMKVILGEHNRHLEFSEQMNHKFMELELNNGGFDSIASALANLIGLPVVIFSSAHGVLSCSEEKQSAVFDSLFERSDDGTLRLNGLISSHLANMRSHDVLQRLKIPGIPHMIVRRVVIRQQICGYIFVVCQCCTLDDMQLIVLHHAATSTALEISKLQKLEEHVRLMQNSLFLDLLAGNVKTKNEGESRAKLLQWPALPVRVAVVDIDRFGSVIQNMSEEKIQNLKENLHLRIRDHLSAQNHPCTVMMHSDRFVTLLPNSIPEEKLTAVFNHIYGVIKGQCNLSSTIGISDPSASYLDIPLHYEEACDAIAIGRVPNSGGPVHLISDVRLERALLKSCSNVYFRQYVACTIGKLESYDQQHGTALTGTLDAFIENMGARQITAEKLFIHRNTLSNRLEKIEKIIGLDLSKNENLYHLSFALKIRHFISGYV